MLKSAPKSSCHYIIIVDLVLTTLLILLLTPAALILLLSIFFMLPGPILPALFVGIIGILEGLLICIPLFYAIKFLLNASLILAVKTNNLFMVKFLILARANVDYAYPITGETPLLTAVDKNNLKMVKYLFEKGATDTLVKILICAARKGHLDILQYLVEQGKHLNYATADTGETALMHAAEKGQLATVQYLAPKTNIAFQTKNGFTALMCAAENGHLDVVKYLVEQMGNVNHTEQNISEALICSAGKGHLAVVVYLVENGANVNYADSNNRTALVCATEKSHLAVTQYLVEQGADIHHTYDLGHTALVHAATAGHLEIAKYLVEQKANIHSTEWRKNALVCAVGSGNLALVQYLIEQGADVNAKDYSYYTRCKQGALYRAVEKNNLDMFKFLIFTGKNSNIRDKLKKVIDSLLWQEYNNPYDRDQDFTKYKFKPKNKTQAFLKKMHLMLESSLELYLKKPESWSDKLAEWFSFSKPLSNRIILLSSSLCGISISDKKIADVGMTKETFTAKVQLMRFCLQDRLLHNYKASATKSTKKDSRKSGLYLTFCTIMRFYNKSRLGERSIVNILHFLAPFEKFAEMSPVVSSTRSHSLKVAANRITSDTTSSKSDLLPRAQTGGV